MYESRIFCLFWRAIRILLLENNSELFKFTNKTTFENVKKSGENFWIVFSETLYLSIFMRYDLYSIHQSRESWKSMLSTDEVSFVILFWEIGEIKFLKKSFQNILSDFSEIFLGNNDVRNRVLSFETCYLAKWLSGNWTTVFLRAVTDHQKLKEESWNFTSLRI